jgi:CubicO group peptidase (beta-lactamase class C family)
MSPVRATTKVPVGAAGALEAELPASLEDPPEALLAALPDAEPDAEPALDEPAAELEPAGAELEPPEVAGGVVLVLPVDPAGEQAASASAVNAAAAAAASLLGLGVTTNLLDGGAGRDSRRGYSFTYGRHKRWPVNVITVQAGAAEPLDGREGSSSSGRSLPSAVDAILSAGPPGAHLSVAGPDGFRLDACAGLAQAFDTAGPLAVPLTVDHAHDLGSVTKIAGTTCLLAALVSAGALTVDDQAGRFLPGLPTPVGAATLRDLLTHRAGLWEWWPTYLAGGDPVATAAGLPLRYPPRTGRHYSDLGFMILGRVVEAVAAQSLPAAHSALVAGPAGIAELTYAAPPAGHPAVATSTGDRIERRMIATGEPYPVDPALSATADGFPGWRNHVLVGEINDGNAFHAFGGVAGHAGLFGTVSALHALGAVLLAGLDADGPWPAVREFAVAGPDPVQALGFRLAESTVNGCTSGVVWHNGFPGIGFAVLPRHCASVVLATNRLHVPGEPVAFDPLWQPALAAAHHAIHVTDPGGSR